MSATKTRKGALLWFGAIAWSLLIPIIAVVGWSMIKTSPLAADNSLNILHNPKQDPKAGALLIADKVKDLRLDPNESRRVVFVALGSCQGCSARKFDSALLNPAKEALKIGLVNGTTSEPVAIPGLDKIVCLTWEQYRQLNAAWEPRAYVCSPDGKVLQCQTSFEKIPEFLRRTL